MMSHVDDLNEWKYKLELSKYRWDMIYKILSTVLQVASPFIVIWTTGYRLQTIEGKADSIDVKADRNAVVAKEAVKEAAEKAAEKVIEKME